MKKIISNSIIVILLFGTFGIANAQQTNVNAEANVRVKAEVKGERENSGVFGRVKAFFQGNAEVRKEKQEERKEKIEEKKEERQGNYLEIMKRNLTKMLERFQAAINRENNITARIVSRIDKVKAAGGNVEASEKAVVEAKVHFANAQTSLNNLKVVIDTELSLYASSTATTTASSTALRRESMDKIKKAAAEVKEHLKKGHAMLIRAVVNLKGVSSTRVQATTTVETSN